MTDRPMLFSGPMVRALLEGRKTQTRRLLKPQPEPWRDFYLEGGCQQSDWSFVTGLRTDDGVRYRFGIWMHSAFHESRFQPLPYAPGGLIWVRESGLFSDLGFEQDCAFRADGEPDQSWTRPIRWRPSIYMPRWASRLTLEVIDVRIERLQDISEADALAEGAWAWAEDHDAARVMDSAREAYAHLWDDLNAKRAPWAMNPWVVALTFAVHRQNIDRLKAGREAA